MCKEMFHLRLCCLERLDFGLMSLTSFDQVRQQLTPLFSELVGARQTAIATDHTQVGDAQLDQVTGGFGASLLGAEILTAGTSNHSPTLLLGKEEGFQKAMQISRRCRVI